jgi:hypothetical protein
MAAQNIAIFGKPGEVWVCHDRPAHDLWPDGNSVSTRPSADDFPRCGQRLSKVGHRAASFGIKR